MKILWLSPYPIKLLTPELKITGKKNSHSASWIVNLSEALVKNNNIKLHILTSSAHIPFTQTVENNGITFHVVKYTIPLIKKGFPEFFPYDSLTWYKGLIKNSLKIIEKIKPDLIHAYGTEKGYSLLALKSGYKNITSIQGIMSLIHKVSPSPKSYFQIPIEKYCIKNNKIFECRTCLDKEFVKSINPDCKIYYIPRVVSSKFFIEKWQPENNSTIVFVGGIMKRKGVEILINSIKKVNTKMPSIKVKFIGGYSKKYHRYLINKINRFQLSENIEFLGRRNSEEIADILSKSTAFVLPTLIDNSPNSLAEAMAVGMPCIATNVGGIPSMIENNKDGILFPSRNVNVLAEKILKVFTDGEFRNRIAINAKQTAYKRNYKDVVVSQTIKVYKEIINGDN